MKKKVRIIATALLAILSAGCVAYFSLLPLEIEATRLEAETVSITFTETGSYEYTRYYTVYPVVAGEIVELAVEKGDVVQAGDIIAVVNASDYMHQINQLNSTIAGYGSQISNLMLQEQQQRDSIALTLSSLEGQLMMLDAEKAHYNDMSQSLKAQISIQENIVDLNMDAIQYARSYLRDMRDYGEDYEITQARQALNAAQNTYAQSLQLLEQMQAGDTPEAVWESQRLALEIQIDAVTHQMNSTYTSGMHQYYNAQIDAARHTIVQLEEMSGRATLLAPVGGIITSLPASDQNLILPQTPAAVLAERPMVETYVPLREIDGVTVGDTVELILDRRLGSEHISGVIVDIEEEAQVILSALGVEERKVRVSIRPEQEVLGIGYNVDVRFAPYTFQDVVAVPKTAVFETADGSFVWLINSEGNLEICTITCGSETRDSYIVDEGLAFGNTVVTDANDDSLREGRRAVMIK